MTFSYVVQDAPAIYSPALLFYEDLIRHNIQQAIEIVGGPHRLRPHVKTHKTREVVRLEMDAGITRHKCATLAEAEMLAQTGACDVLIAYPMVGPNISRLARLAARHPETSFATLADHPDPVRDLSAALSAAGSRADVLLDVDVGQHRTGLPPGDAAVDLYRLIASLPALRPGGLHAYDGHNHQESPAEREAAALAALAPVLALRHALEGQRLPVPRLVLGGTPTFTAFARLDLPGQECSPGTCFLHDDGYGGKFPDLAGFRHAALLLTRVISRPAPNRATLDLGYKAVASDPPAGKRCRLLDLPPYHTVLQNEEHLVIETATPCDLRPGDVVYAVPTHICPTVALHRSASVIRDGRLVGTWDIAARDRVLTV